MLWVAHASLSLLETLVLAPNITSPTLVSLCNINTHNDPR